MTITAARAPKYKSGTALMKAADVKTVATDDEKGIVEQIVSVFGNVDSYGDVVVAGAFKNSLTEWSSKGDPIPAIWSHAWMDPFAHIGEVLEAEETEKGLRVKYQVDLDNPTGAQVYRLLKGRRVTQASFAFDILDSGWETYTDEATGKEYEVYELRELGLIEVGPCLVGVNRETELLSAKVQELADAVSRSGLTPELVEQVAAARDLLDQITKSSPAPAGDTAQNSQPPKDAAAPTSAPQPSHDAASTSARSASARALSQITTALIESALEDSQ